MRQIIKVSSAAVAAIVVAGGISWLLQNQTINERQNDLTSAPAIPTESECLVLARQVRQAEAGRSPLPEEELQELEGRLAQCPSPDD